MAYGTETVGPQSVVGSITSLATFKSSGSLVLGRFAELGGSLDLYGNWVPAQTQGDNDDPYTAAARIMAVAGYLENTAVPLERARQIAIRDTKQHFDDETDPQGKEWPELSEGWAAWKEVHAPGTGILELEGTLRDDATSQRAWIIIGETLVFDPNVLPLDEGFNYGAFHQTGGSEFETVPTSEFVKGKGFVEKGTKAIAGTPPRPFIGLSNAAILEIAAEFEQWFAGVGIVFDEEPVIGSFFRAGGVQNIVRTSRGPRFAKMRR